MKILMVHNYYQQRGGEDVSADTEAELLRQAGHRVKTYFVHNNQVSHLGLVRTAVRAVWSVQAYQDVLQILSKESYDVLHVQNFFPLISPSVYYAAKKCGVPVVQSIRNYRLFCLNGYFSINQEVCERCFHRRFAWPGIVRRCYRNSFLGSWAVALMQFVHGQLLRTWFRKVDRFIALSEFVKGKLMEAGVPEETIVVKPNFVFPDPDCKPTVPKNYFVYVGLLSGKKGCRTLLKAWRVFEESERDREQPLEDKGQSPRLLIMGEGPLREELERQAGDRIEFLGFRDSSEVLEIIRHATALIFPSEWYETFGRVAIEAYSVGTPVIASRIGAVQELIRDGETGLLFTPGDYLDLAEKIKKLTVCGAGLREECRRYYDQKFSSREGLLRLENVYKDVM